MILKMVITPLSKYQIAETKTFEKVKNKIDKKLYLKIKNFVYPQLRENPFYGKKIKKLKDNLEGYYIVSVNDFVYNPRISVNAPVGPIKRNKLKEGVMSPLYLIFKCLIFMLLYNLGK